MLTALVEQFQELADHAAGFQVELAVVNHCFLVYLGWHQEWMIRLTDRPNAGACVDPGNYLHYGNQDPVNVCKDLAGMTMMVRAGDTQRVPDDEVITTFNDKGDFRQWTAASFGHGAVDQEACYRNLAEGGYKGFVSLKTAGSSPDGPLAAIRQSWQALSETLERVS